MAEVPLEGVFRSAVEVNPIEFGEQPEVKLIKEFEARTTSPAFTSLFNRTLADGTRVFQPEEVVTEPVNLGITSYMVRGREREEGGLIRYLRDLIGDHQDHRDGETTAFINGTRNTSGHLNPPNPPPEYVETTVSSEHENETFRIAYFGALFDSFSDRWRPDQVHIDRLQRGRVLPSFSASLLPIPRTGGLLACRIVQVENDLSQSEWRMERTYFCIFDAKGNLLPYSDTPQGIEWNNTFAAFSVPKTHVP